MTWKDQEQWKTQGQEGEGTRPQVVSGSPWGQEEAIPRTHGFLFQELGVGRSPGLEFRQTLLVSFEQQKQVCKPALSREIIKIYPLAQGSLGGAQ